MGPAGLVPPKNRAWYSETPFDQVVMDFSQASSSSGETPQR